MDAKLKYLLGFALIAAICVLALMANPDAEFGGADGAAEEDIVAIAPDYEPWYDSPWAPAGETESMLFALQASIGGIVIGYFIAFAKCRKAEDSA